MILLSIHKKHVDKIFSGQKTFEYRKILPTKIPTKVIIYCCAPISKIVGEFEISEILCHKPKTLFKKTKKSGCIDKQSFLKYFENKPIAYAMKIKNVKRYDKPFKYSKHPPQSFCYFP